MTYETVVKMTHKTAPTHPRASSCLLEKLKHDPTLNLLLDSLSDQAVFVVDPQGVIQTWSEGCLQTKGFTAEEALGENFTMFYPQSDITLGYPMHNLKIAERDGRFHEEAIRLRKCGSPYIAEISCYPIFEGSTAIGFVKVVRDVSERSRSDGYRDAFEEKLKKANVDLEGFCHSAAHDLRAPIRSIMSRCRILQEDFSDSLPPEASSYLDALVRSGLSLANLVEDLLRFARLGEGQVARKEIDATALVHQIWHEIAEPGIIDVQENVRAFADPSMFQIILRNLLENACKYTESTPALRFRMEMVSGVAVYSLKDNGIGFDMEHADKVFHPFIRLHGCDTYQGSGIGLANVQRIIDRHGGQVWAESSPGQGSTFFFTVEKLPLRVNEATCPDRSSGSSATIRSPQHPG